MNPLWILLVHKGWERWTHAIGFGEPPQCISIYVSANLIKWKNYWTDSEAGENKTKKKKQKKTSTKTARELRLAGETQAAWRDPVIILKKKIKNWKRERDKEEEWRKKVEVEVFQEASESYEQK